MVNDLGIDIVIQNKNYIRAPGLFDWLCGCCISKKI